MTKLNWILQPAAFLLMSHRQGQSWPEGFLIKVIQVHAQQAAMHQLNTEKPFWAKSLWKHQFLSLFFFISLW